MATEFDARLKELIASYPDIRGDQMAYYLRMLFDIAYHDGSNYRLRTSSTGTFVFSGLSTAFIPTTMQVSTTAIKLPTTPLTARNHISIFNTSETETLYLGNSDVTADRALGTTAGAEIQPLGSFNIDITDSIELYGIVATGSIVVKIYEVA